MTCIIWSQEQSLPDTISALYKKVIEYLVKHWQTKESQQPAAAQEILIKLGGIALEGLVDKNSKLIFKEDDFDSPNTVEQGCSLGLVTKDCTLSGFDMVTNVSFIHKTFQEYCAALYLANLTKCDPNLCTKYLSNMDTKDMEYVLKFSCGMNQNATKLILACIVDKSCQRIKLLNDSGGVFEIGESLVKDPWRLPPILLFEAESHFGFNGNLHELLKPLVLGIKLVNRRRMYNSEYLHILQHYKQMTDTPHAWPNFVEEASIYIIEELNELSLPAEILAKLPNLRAITVKGIYGIRSDCASFVLQIQKAMTSHSIKVLDFDDGCKCDIYAIKSFLDTQPNLISLGIPPQSKFEETDVTILGKVLQEINARSGSITKVTLTGDRVDDQLLLNLRKHCDSLQKLVISSCPNITQSGFSILFEAMITFGRKLQQLNSLKDQYKGGSTHTAKSLPLKYLDLKFCDIGDFAYKLVDAMTYMESLEYLNLKKLGEKLFHKMGPAFAHLPKLVTLVLEGNKVGNSFHAIAQGINACKLTKLNLNRTNLTEESNKVLACMKLPLLTELYLDEAGITSDGAVALSKSLKHMQSLRTWDLRYNMIGSRGAQAISLSFQYTPKLSSLSLSSNNIGSDGAQALSASLQYIPQLRHLVLHNNNIGSEGAQALSASFQYLPKLYRLGLDHNPIGPAGVEEIFKHLAHLKCLNCLCLQKLFGKPTSNANECTLLQKCIEALKKSHRWKEDSSEQCWFHMRLFRNEIATVNEVVSQWVD